MNHAVNPVLTAAITVFGGAVVLVVGQVIQRFFLEPIQEQRQVIGEIAHALIFEANVGSLHAPEEREATSSNLRNLASRLRATLWTVPRYTFLERLGWVPAAGDVIVASDQLIGWSNSIAQDSPDNYRRRLLIAEKLGIKGVA